MRGFGLNLPNLISLGRLLLVPLAISLILDGRYWGAFWVFVVAGISDALDGFIAKHFDRRTRLGALLDPLADKVLLVSVYVTLGIAGQIWAWLVVLVVFRDVMIIGGFLLIQALAELPKPTHPLFISKVNTGVQVAMVGYVLARRGLGAEAGFLDFLLGIGVAVTTVGSGLTYLVRWARILARSEQAL
ncbi:MAG: CDP-alcohol phosphatidyltransferase family protein [Alphaproteobacteria bacterium]|nr:CDP-alcohol phosphatidyltransferase family protein [Alphaproteobacteria bacterium]MBV9373875.1 CDP-alcohol phosphatidyltransferase family protein [Alphaproteobacteria bacterium]MBV9815775.1 CDP-alcohol phosphatidyltransferase family protein [Alphaproteobacteria bacterium]